MPSKTLCKTQRTILYLQRRLAASWRSSGRSYTCKQLAICMGRSIQDRRQTCLEAHPKTIHKLIKRGPSDHRSVIYSINNDQFSDHRLSIIVNRLGVAQQCRGTSFRPFDQKRVSILNVRHRFKYS